LDHNFYCIFIVSRNKINVKIAGSHAGVFTGEDGKSAQAIVNYQADATFQALIEQSVPSVKISIKDPDVTNIGYLISFIQSTVYYLCILLDVNWANNPKVVIGKNICNDALKNQIPSEQRVKIRKEIANEKFKNF